MKKTTFLLAYLLGSYALGNAQSLGNYVWHDANMNGTQDVSEVGIPNIEARLYDANNTLLATTLTNVNGFYQFTSVNTGTYYVEFGNLPAGSVWTVQDIGASDTYDSDVNTSTNRTNAITIVTNQSNESIDAGLVLVQTSNTLPSLAENLEVSPNPAHNEVKLVFTPHFSQKEVSIKIMSVEGKTIEQKWIEVFANQPTQLSLNLNHLTSGMYLIQVSGSQVNPVIRKLVVY